MILRSIGERLKLLKPIPGQFTHLRTELVGQEMRLHVRNTYAGTATVRVIFGGAWSGWVERTVPPGEHVLVIDQHVNVGGASAKVELQSVEG